MLTLYFKDGCGVCKNVKRLLDAKKIEYRMVDVGTPAGWDEAKRLGVMAAGTVLDESGERVNVSSL